MKTNFLSLMYAVVVLGFFSGCKKKEEVPNPSDLPCTINSDMVLTNHNPNGVDYVVGCEVEVSGALLTIEPGVSILFKNNTSLQIADNAAISINGTESEPVTMHGAEPGMSWKGMLILSNDTRNRINHLDIRNTGSSVFFSDVFGGFIYDAKIAIGVSGKADITNTQVNTCGGIGIMYGSQASVTQFYNNKVSGCVLYPVMMYAGNLTPGLSFMNSEFKQNGENCIALYALSSNTEVNNPVTVNEAPVPYLAYTSIDFHQNVTFMQGVEMRVSEEQSLRSLGNTTQWSINGTAAKPVNIKGKNESLAGYWNGILVGGASTGMFTYLNVSGGGKDFTGFNVPFKANINVTDTYESSLTVTNCTSSLNTSGCDVGVRTGNGNTTFVNNSPGLSACVD